MTRLSGLAARHGFTLVAGMFERSEDPGRPYNTLVVVGPEGLRASYRKIHLYDSFGYRESDRLLAGRPEPVVVDVFVTRPRVSRVAVVVAPPGWVVRISRFLRS